MASPLLFYVSGHGYGHARRMTQVIRALLHVRPDLTIHVRSAAPPRIFEPLPPECVARCDIDAGLLEKDVLTIDRERSLERIGIVIGRADQIIEEEVAAVRALRPGLILSDIPFLAGDVAAIAGVRCVGISNFTWDWIYENLFPDNAVYASLAGSIARSYEKMDGLLALPLGRTCPTIRNTIHMPLIAMQSRRDKSGILAQLNLSPDDRRPRVLFGTRGSLAPGVLSAAANSAAEFLFLCPYDSGEVLPSNVHRVTLDSTLDFSDVLRVADIVVSKLGYGMISECIATQTRLVWPPREGFIEDAIVEKEAPPYVPMLRISRADYDAGRWAMSLRQAMRLPIPTRRMPTDGAEVCAKWILDAMT